MPRRSSPALTSGNEHAQWEWANVCLKIDGFKRIEICNFERDPNFRAYQIKSGPSDRPIIREPWCGIEDRPHVHLDKIAFEYGPGPLCLSGGFGSAKTYTACEKILWFLDTFPNNRVVIARKQWTTLKDTTMSTFFKVCPPAAYDERYGGRRVDSEKYLRLARSQSEILWLHLDQDDVEKIIRGLEINGFFVDQAEEVPEDVFAMLMTRLGRWDKAKVPDYMLDAAYLEQTYGVSKWPWMNRVGKPIVPTYPIIGCNPDVFTHWIYRRFHEDSQDWKERYSKQNYRMLNFRSDENRFLPKQNLDEMLRADESFQRRFVRGEWGIPEGQIHDVKDSSVLELAPEVAGMLLRTCNIHQSMDHGDASPTTVGWWAVDGDGNYFGIAEYYKGNLLVSDHRRGIKELNDALIRVANVQQFFFKGRYADPAIFIPTQQKWGGRVAYSDDYEDRNPNHGFRDDDAIWWDKGDNDEMGTRNFINEQLREQGTGRKWTKLEMPEGMSVEHQKRFAETKEEPRIHPITKKYGYWHRLFFLKKTPLWPYGFDHSLTEIRSQRRIRIGMELGKPTFSDERDDAIPDHGYDMIRYFMASRAPKAAAPQKQYSRNSFFGARDEYLKWKRTGGARRMGQVIQNA